METTLEKVIALRGTDKELADEVTSLAALVHIKLTCKSVDVPETGNQCVAVIDVGDLSDTKTAVNDFIPESTIVIRVRRANCSDRADIVLPGEEAQLLTVLDRIMHDKKGRLIAVVGTAGGVGVSTISAGISARLASKDRGVALVDLGSGGCGLDVITGIEGVTGLRWQDIETQENMLLAQKLIRNMPSWAGVKVLSGSYESGAILLEPRSTHVVELLLRSMDYVIADCGANYPGLTSFLRQANVVVVVTGNEMRCLAGLRRLAKTLIKGEVSVSQTMVVVTGRWHTGCLDISQFLGRIKTSMKLRFELRVKRRLEAGLGPPIKGWYRFASVMQRIVSGIEK